MLSAFSVRTSLPASSQIIQFLASVSVQAYLRTAHAAVTLISAADFSRLSLFQLLCVSPPLIALHEANTHKYIGVVVYAG
jgi:hypothetical protein